MIFGPTPTSEAEGWLLARALGGIKKGETLTAQHIAQLQSQGIEQILGAQLEPGDIPENEAANMIAAKLAGAQMRHPAADQGRIHFYSEAAGLLLMDPDKITALNHVSEDIALACLAPFAPVKPQQLVATLKIIPLASARDKIAEVSALAELAGLRINPFRPLNITLLCTRDPSKKNQSKKDMSAKAENITRRRVEALGSRLTAAHCDHESAVIAAKLGSIASDLILIHGASAIMDRRDVIPSAIEQAGGRLIHFGMPTDPGNLLLLAEYQGKAIIGLPGCARSPARNGFDLVLERIVCGLNVSADDIMTMGVGGLMLGANIEQERYG